MIIDSKPRNFEYIDYKGNYPLQLKGNLKRKARPQSSKPYTNKYNNQNVLGLDKQNKSKLISKIVDNYQDLKYCLPMDYDNIKRKSSIKTYDKQKHYQVSGAAFLMIKSTGQNHLPERKHLTDRSLSINNKTQELKTREKRHYWQANLQSCDAYPQKPKRISQTLVKKLQNDIYSKIELKEHVMSSTVKMSKRNMFTQGVDLGFDKQKNSRISCAKRYQIMGSSQLQEGKNRKAARSDWNKSSFTLG